MLAKVRVHRRPHVVAWVAVMFALSGTVAGSASAGTLDQQQTTATAAIFLDSASARAQSYTAGISGQQDQVDLLLEKDTAACGPEPAGLIVDIHAVDSAGQPDGPALDTTTIPAASIPEVAPDPPANYTSASFASPVTVAIGTQYAIVLRSPIASSCYGWYESTANPYERGMGHVTFDNGDSWSSDSNLDFAFKTYVVPATAPPAKDTDPPETTITKDVKRSETGKVKFRFESDEAGASFECKLKGPDVKRKLRQFDDCDSPRKYKNLDDGRFRFKVRAIDAAGNGDPTPAKDRFRVVD